MAGLLAAIVVVTAVALGVTIELYRNADREAQRGRDAEKRAGEDRDYALGQEGAAREAEKKAKEQEEDCPGGTA